MTKEFVNLIKLCVGAQNVSDLYEWQKNRLIHDKNLENRATFFITRMKPKRENDKAESKLILRAVFIVVVPFPSRRTTTYQIIKNSASASTACSYRTNASLSYTSA